VIITDPGTLENLAHPDHPRFDEPIVTEVRKRFAAWLAEPEQRLVRSGPVDEG
jgi:hypothetical protein